MVKSVSEYILQKEKELKERQEIECPVCKNKGVVKNGKRYLKCKVVQSYQCRNKHCGHRFYLSEVKPIWSMS